MEKRIKTEETLATFDNYSEPKSSNRIGANTKVESYPKSPDKNTKNSNKISNKNTKRTNKLLSLKELKDTALLKI